MAIQTLMEFEAVLSDIVLTLDKMIYAVGSDPILEKARRALKAVHQQVREGNMPTDKTRGPFEEQLGVLRDKLDDKMQERLWDLSDYLELNG